MATRCLVCKEGSARVLLDLGLQPMTNRFSTSPDAKTATFPLAIAQCQRCAVIQLAPPAPPSELMAPFEWITYNEPEAHLDELAGAVLALPDARRSCSIAGTSYKDDSLLERLRLRGATVWRVDPQADLKVTAPTAGLETIQDRLWPAAARSIAADRGQADVVLARHILEHAHDPAQFMAAVGELVRPGGHVVFEVPDSSPALDTLDYTAIWEEHVLYLTPASFLRTLREGDFEIVRQDVYPYGHENSLVVIVRWNGPAPPLRHEFAGQPDAEVATEIARARAFAEAFPTRRARVRDALRALRARGQIALLGAGHLACAFVEYFDVASEIAFVVDDNPLKRGLYMPGSGLPIYASDALLTEGVAFCLLSVSPQAEARVVARNRQFTAGGGVFASIFPSSPLALQA